MRHLEWTTRWTTFGMCLDLSGIRRCVCGKPERLGVPLWSQCFRTSSLLAMVCRPVFPRVRIRVRKKIQNMLKVAKIGKNVIIKKQ